MNSRLHDKVAIITGASSGIGRAAARLFAEAGARLVVGGRDQTRLDDLVIEIRDAGGTAVACVADLRDEDSARVMVDMAMEEHGGLDIAFNNAGTLGALGPSTEMSAEDWRGTLDVNLTGAFLCAKQQVPALLRRGGGSLIFTSSFVGQGVGFPGMAAYAASKAGLVGLTQALAAEFGRHGIRVNALLPGGTDTPMGRSVADTPEAQEQVAQLHALGRLALPEEIARYALFLASEESAFVTGASLYADGGVTIARA